MHRYGFDETKFAAAPGASIDGADQFTVAFVGKAEPRKGLHFLLDAWLASGVCERGRLIGAGAIDGPYHDLLAERLAHPSVAAVGFVDVVAVLLRRCHAMALPSVEEGSALVTHEAQAAGSAHLVSDACGARLDHGVRGLAHSAGSVRQFASHLRCFAENRDQRSSMRNEALTNSRHLTCRHAGVELSRIYEAAIATVR